MSYLTPFAPREPQPAARIKARCAEFVAKHRTLPENWQATTIGVLQAVCEGGEARHSVLAYLFGKTSSKALTQAEWFALYAWVFPHHLDACPAWCPNVTDTWHAHPALKQEIKNLLDARMLEQGQIRLF